MDSCIVRCDQHDICPLGSFPAFFSPDLLLLFREPTALWWFYLPSIFTINAMHPAPPLDFKAPLFYLPFPPGDNQRLWFTELQVPRVSNCHGWQVQISTIIIIISNMDRLKTQMGCWLKERQTPIKNTVTIHLNVSSAGRRARRRRQESEWRPIGSSASVNPSSICRLLTIILLNWTSS